MKMNELFDFENLPKEEQHYEEMFLGMLQRQGKIEPFLDSVFKFLLRRTDFYLLQERADQSFGFPAGYAKQMVLDKFQKYDSIPKEALKQRMNVDQKPPAENVEQKKPKQQQTQISSEREQPLSPGAAVSGEKNPKNKKEIIPSSTSNRSIRSTSGVNNKDCLEEQQKEFQKNSASYNGAQRENYSWTQTIKDIDIQLKIDSSVKSGKDVQIKIQKDSLQVLVKSENHNVDTGPTTTTKTTKMITLIDEKFSWKCRPDESMWSLFPGDHIHVFIEKNQERWWEKLFESEAKLDLKNICPEKPLEDLDQEAQVKIKQMMYDESQKRQGLPTSEEQKNLSLLKNAWNSEGSPFKDTPFDPSVLKQQQDHQP